MFCYQCEQTAKGKGCDTIGVCGKTSDVAALQDLLIYALQGLAVHAVEGRGVGVVDHEVDVFTLKGVFSTLTNVNFDPERLAGLIHQCVSLRERLKERVQAAGGKIDSSAGPVGFKPAEDLAGLVRQGEEIENIMRPTDEDPDIVSLKHTLRFGLKGVAAYADHAQILGQEDEAVYAFIQEGLASMLRKDLTLQDWVSLVLKCGTINLRAMELLDAGNTGTYGHPVPTKVLLGVKKGKAIAVSGHDLQDLDKILRQSAGKDINVYTHGEMLPCHGYPELKKYPHFYGHYGTAWQNQVREFAHFPCPAFRKTPTINR